MTPYKRYRAALARLPLRNPTPEDMAALCPYLPPQEAVQMFTTGDGMAPCPPLRVHAGFHILQYTDERIRFINAAQRGTLRRKAITKTLHPVLRWVCATRTPASYARSGRKPLFEITPMMQAAMRFAEDHWGGALVVDDWVDIMDIYIQDPTRLVNNRYNYDQPRTRQLLHVVLRRTIGEIFADTSKKLESEVIDDAIADMTIDPFIRRELKGGRDGQVYFNCAHCAGGLLTDACSVCGLRFREDPFREGWRTPLSQKMVNFLRGCGHRFGCDPELAWRRERERYAEAQHRREGELYPYQVVQ